MPTKWRNFMGHLERMQELEDVARSPLYTKADRLEAARSFRKLENSVEDAMVNYGKRLVPVAAGTIGGLGAAGVGAASYALGDADTTSNTLKNFSNNTLGTNFRTQSRLSDWLS